MDPNDNQQSLYLILTAYRSLPSHINTQYYKMTAGSRYEQAPDHNVIIYDLQNDWLN